MGDEAAIELTGLTKTYRRGRRPVRAVDGVTLRVPAGQVFGLLGPNGAGKTTTIKMLCGLITPSAGRILLGGYDVARQRGQAVRQIGAVLEGSRNVYWSMSAWQNLLYFGRLKGLRGSELKPRARWLLGELGLWQRRSEPVGTFSRGMQQKVAVAAALITDPPIVLLDEPTIGLDVGAARTVKDWVVRLAHEQHKTVVLTTHQLAMAEELSDRVAVIRDGAIVADLPTKDLLGRFREDRYEVRVAGLADQLVAACLPGDVSVASEDGVTRITLPTNNHDDLFKLLAEVQSHGLPLLSVRQIEPDLEEVFLRLVTQERAA